MKNLLKLALPTSAMYFGLMLMGLVDLLFVWWKNAGKPVQTTVPARSEDPIADSAPASTAVPFS